MSIPPSSPQGVRCLGPDCQNLVAVTRDRIDKHIITGGSAYLWSEALILYPAELPPSILYSEECAR